MEKLFIVLFLAEALGREHEFERYDLARRQYDESIWEILNEFSS